MYWVGAKIESNNTADRQTDRQTTYTQTHLFIDFFVNAAPPTNSGYYNINSGEYDSNAINRMELFTKLRCF